MPHSPSGKGSAGPISRASCSSAIRAGYHPGDPRWAAAARLDGRKAPRALPPAACLARSADRARLRLSPIRIQRSTRTLSSARLRWDRRGNLATTSASLRYWNSARQRYCRQLVRYRKNPSVSADPTAKPAAQTRAESRVLDLSKTTAGERQTVCWRGEPGANSSRNRKASCRRIGNDLRCRKSAFPG